MNSLVEALKKEFLREVAAATSTHDVEALRVKYLGRKGPLQGLLKQLRDIPEADRPAFGQQVNDLKILMESEAQRLQHHFLLSEQERQLSSEQLDITIPGRRPFLGGPHLLNAVIDEILDILISMGFSVQCGPDIESDYYNFESLNFAPDHPARAMHDTFYIDDKTLLRTHTTNIQVRLMEVQKPPIRIASPGRAYRNEAVTSRSHVFFHQVDPLYIDKGVTFADLLATLDLFLHKLFRRPIETRYRASYFPFVEPGMEVDVRCIICSGHGCSVCKHSGWLEVLGAGMVHPEVLKNGGIDPEVYSGFAWGMGVERLAMIRHGITDIRYFTENDVRFLNQFSSYAAC